MLTVTLGALLHDIGKVGQRAGLSGNHSDIGSEMLRAVLPESIGGVAGLVSMHHDCYCLSSPGFEPLKILILSDWISAGERSTDETSTDAHSPLISIFSNINVGKGEPKSGGFYYAPSTLRIDPSTIFPKRAFEPLEASYKRLWDALKKDLKELQKLSDPNAYLLTSLYLMKKYTLFVPSAAYKSVPDITLYDHSRIAAAIAACFDNKEISDVQREFESEDYVSPRFLLLKGDISGIQRFIYTITSKGALRGLRGRSFYLQLLSETVAKFILRELGYPQTNLIYCGGGHFYLLLKSSDEVRLGEIRKRIEKAMLEMHKGDLFLALGWVKLSVRDLLASSKSTTGNLQSDQSLASKWSEAEKAVNRAKLQKFSQTASDSYEILFGPFPDEQGGPTHVCDVCRREANLNIRSDRGWVAFDPADQPDAVKLCDMCRSFEEIGEKLPKAEYLVESAVKLENSPHLLCSFEQLGIHYYMCKRDELKQLMESLGKSDAVIYSLSTDFIDEQLVSLASEYSAALGYRLVARAAPMNNGRILDNTEIAMLSEGVQRLGILRMDVDDLGLVFSRGLANATFSRISTLSTMLSLFFDGWVEELCKEEGRIYLIYSGGDDLFIVGSWDAIPEIALSIRNDFRRYTCHNPNITLSAGISIVDDMFPIYKAADISKEHLEEAKGLERDGEKKDAVCFLGEVMDWKELEISRSIALSLMSWIKDGRNGNRLPRSVLGIMYRAYELHQKNRDLLRRKSVPIEDLEKLALYDRWRWRMVYYLDRLGVRSNEFQNDLRKLSQSILESKWEGIRSPREMIKYLAVPTRWAEMLTREVENE